MSTERIEDKKLEKVAGGRLPTGGEKGEEKATSPVPPPIGSRPECDTPDCDTGIPEDYGRA